MHNAFREYLVKLLGADRDAIDLILSRSHFIEVKRNGNLLNQGQICKSLFFVAKGCLQSYIHNSDMDEITREIITEGNWYCDLRSFNKQEPATEGIRAIEHSCLIEIGQTDFLEMTETIPRFSEVYQKILEAYYTSNVHRVNTFLTLSALERIKWLMQHRPTVMTRVSSKIIASYLGIHKDVYSRLKGKL